jgi:hypothetical protein
MLLSKSNTERFRMGCEMFETAKALTVAGLLAEGSGDLRRRLFLRFYGRDFSPRQRERILRRIEEWEGASTQ